MSRQGALKDDELFILINDDGSSFWRYDLDLSKYVQIDRTDAQIEDLIQRFDINGLTKEAPNENAEFLYNKHTPVSPNFLYEETQTLDLTRDGGTEVYEANLPPPNAPRRGNTTWGDADGDPIEFEGSQTVSWDDEVYDFTDGFVNGHGSVIFGDAPETDLVLTINDVFVPFSISFHIAPNNDSISFLTDDGVADLPSDFRLIINGTSYQFFNPVINQGRKVYQSTVFTGLPDGTDFTLDMTGTGVEFGRGDHGGLIGDLWSARWDTSNTGQLSLDIRPGREQRFTSETVSDYSNSSPVPLDIVNRIETERGGDFYLKGERHTHDSKAYLRLTFYNDEALTDVSSADDIHPNFNPSSGQRLRLNFKSDDNPATNENRKADYLQFAELLSQVLTPKERKLQNDINFLKTLLSRNQVESGSNVETEVLDGSIALVDERPTGTTIINETFVDTIDHVKVNTHRFIAIRRPFSENHDGFILQLREDGDTHWDDIFHGGVFVEVPTTEADAYYYVELAYALDVTGTIRLVNRTSEPTAIRFNGRIRTPFRVSELTTINSSQSKFNYHLPGEIVHLVIPQGISGSSIVLTSGDNSFYYGWSSQAITNFVNAAIGSLSETVPSDLHGILVEKSERKQIYIIGSSATFLSTLTHLIVGNKSYHLSQHVSVSGGTHFKVVQGINGNTLQGDDSPLKDLTDGDTENVAIRKNDGTYIGSVTAEYPVGYYERQESVSSVLSENWKRVHFVDSDSYEKIKKLPDLPIKSTYRHGGQTHNGVAIETVDHDDQEQFRIPVTPRKDNTRMNIRLWVYYRGDTTGTPDDGGIQYKVYRDTTQVGHTEERHIEVSGELKRLKRNLYFEWFDWPSTTDEINYIFYANRLVSGTTSMPIHIERWFIIITEYPAESVELIT